MGDENGDPAMLAGVARLPSLAAWARSLPSTVGQVVSGSDLTTPYLYTRVPAVGEELSGVRTELGRWAKAVDVGVEQSEDMVLAVDEAVANAVEHAYQIPGLVTVFAACSRLRQMLHVVVSDSGTWRPPPVDVGTRGRGLSIMTGVADRFDLHHGRTGTTVLLGWALK